MPIDNAPTGKTPAKKAVPPAQFSGVDEGAAQADPLDAVNTPERPEESVKAAPEVAHDDNFTFVRMPNGEVRAVRNDAIQNIGSFDSTAGTPEVQDEEVYVHLANGEVHRVKQSTVPGSAGTNAPNGYFQHEGHSHFITAVYPVETKNPEKG